MLQSIFSNWVTLVVTGLISVILTPVLIHGLGDFHYGVWILVGSVLEYSSFVDMGLRTTLQRFVAKLEGVHQRKALNQTLATSLVLSVPVSLLVCLLAVIFASVLPNFFGLSAEAKPLFAKVIVLLGLSVAITLPARILGSYLCGLQRYDIFNLASIATVAIRAILLVAVLRLGYGVIACSAVTFVVAVLSLTVQWRLVCWADPEVSLCSGAASWAQARELLSFSIYVFLASMGDFLRFRVDSFVIARWLVLSSVTPFNIASRIVEYLRSATFTILGPLMTTMSALEGQRRHEDLKGILLFSTKIMTLISLFSGAMLWLYGRPLIRIWVGPKYEAAYAPLMILVLGQVVALAQSPSINLMLAQGRNRPLGWWTFFEGVMNLALSIHWAPRYGLAGVALGTAIPQIFVKLTIQPWYVLRVSRTTIGDYLTRAIAGPAMATILFLLIARPVCQAVDTTRVFSLLVSAAIGTLLYCFIACFVALSSSERQVLLDQVRRFASSSRPAVAI
jgi:O-antigen/teichoic acid export membrane protein